MTLVGLLKQSWLLLSAYTVEPSHPAHNSVLISWTISCTLHCCVVFVERSVPSLLLAAICTGEQTCTGSCDSSSSRIVAVSLVQQEPIITLVCNKCMRQGISTEVCSKTHKIHRYYKHIFFKLYTWLKWTSIIILIYVYKRIN